MIVIYTFLEIFVACYTFFFDYLKIVGQRSVESRTYEELDRAITEAINLVTDNDIKDSCFENV